MLNTIKFILRPFVISVLNSSAKLRWKLHIFKDFWGTKVWTRTTEVVTPLGFKLISGLHPAYELMRTGKFEVEETQIIIKLLPKVDIFVDIGANLGYYTCLALLNNKPVISFEPQQQNLECLFKNLAINGWTDNVEVFPLALSEKPGLLTLYGASGPSASLIKNWASYSSSFKKVVPVSTLDTVLANRFSSEQLFIKIDVEGAEYQVLKGAITILQLITKPIWLLEVCLEEFHPEGKNPDFENIFHLFFENGYLAFTATKKPMQVSANDVASWVKSNHTDSGTFNYIFVGSEDVLLK
jgi:FkbM family methyltransferase